ncbi:MAG: hypothetical protein WDO74_15740 [Pseudomonadota bacterium]
MLFTLIGAYIGERIQMGSAAESRGLIRSLALLLLLSQCSLGASASEKAEAGRISHAVDQLRAASNAQKADLLDALKGLSCETAELCELQRVCVDGYGQHVFALAETARAKSLIAAPDGAAEAAKILDFAQSELAQAAPKNQPLRRRPGVTQRKYKL